MVDLITVDKENRVFHLHNEQLSYIFQLKMAIRLVICILVKG